MYIVYYTFVRIFTADGENREKKTGRAEGEGIGGVMVILGGEAVGGVWGGAWGKKNNNKSTSERWISERAHTHTHTLDREILSKRV